MNLNRSMTVASVVKTANVKRLICELEGIQAIIGRHAGRKMNVLPISPTILDLLIYRNLGVLWEDIAYYGYEELALMPSNKFSTKLNSVILRACCFFQKNYTDGAPPFRAQPALLNCNDIEMHHIEEKDPDYDQYSEGWSLRDRVEEIIKGFQVALTKGAHLNITSHFALIAAGHDVTSIGYTQEQMRFDKLKECNA